MPDRENARPAELGGSGDVEEVSIQTLRESCDKSTGVNSVERFHPSIDISQAGVVAGHPFEQLTGPRSPTSPVVEVG